MQKILQLQPRCPQSTTFLTWWFPKIGVPPNHQFRFGFSIINHPFWGTSNLGNPHIFSFSFFPSAINALIHAAPQHVPQYSPSPYNQLQPTCCYHFECVPQIQLKDFCMVACDIGRLHAQTRNTQILSRKSIATSKRRPNLNRKFILE